ncbi:CDP-alcohol phosphatidyltransferase [Nostocoides sp. HKS02]|uniref:CDP-alcohol phosphatidyltransferase n=1 Tax=Nostocoides sp. HKS02 TaxID=1813880 RepID=UPI001E59DE09|nr:CDP-alcohol phosphatidyltransferase [Tetrasphaera sp. HKS02]
MGAGVAAILLWLALVAPVDPALLSPSALARLPLEGIVALLVLLLAPAAARAAAAVVIGVLLALVLILRVVDLAFEVALGRAARPVTDWRYVGSAQGLLTDSVGRPAAVTGMVIGAAVVLAVLVLLPIGGLRLQRALARHHGGARRATMALTVAWLLCAVTGAQLTSGVPVASTSVADLVSSHVTQVRAALGDRTTFAAQVGVDRFQGTPGPALLQGLHGKDVLVVFVESYGRVAITGSSLSTGVDATLAAATARLRGAGYASQSAFLTSPTFGGISWLAHSTLESGLWIDSQQRYDTLVDTQRLTLSAAFGKAGWRTVGDVPANQVDWPQGKAFYRFDQLYDARNVGYAGPSFGYATMPDQYVLAALDSRELETPGHRPVMAEIDLVSSHSPWAPLPRLVPWSALGDGSVFAPMAAQGSSAATVWSAPSRVQAAYGQSIEYSLNAFVSFLEHTRDPNLVLVVLGDHQPSTVVSGLGASHDVPVSVVARDPAVMSRIAGWGWQPGLRPGAAAPVWRMDTFRDRFLTAYGP